MKKAEFVEKVRSKYPEYKDVDDTELFIRFAKHYPSYIANDNELKKDFLRIANEKETYGANAINLGPEKSYNLITAIPEYRPPRSEYEQFKQHNPDVDWAEVGKAAVSHIGGLVARGFSWDEDANMAYTAAEGAAQGTRALYGIFGESVDPNSIFFKGKQVLGDLFNESPDQSGYEQWLNARDFAQTSMKLEMGEEQILPEEYKVNRKAAAALGIVADPSLFVSFGAGAATKLAGRAAASGLSASGKGLSTLGKSVSKPIETVTAKISEGIAKTVPDVPEGAVKSGVLAATGTGAVVTPIGQTAGTVYAGAKGTQVAGDIIEGIGQQIGKQPSRTGVFAGLSGDLNRSKITRGIARTATVLGGDTVLSTAGTAIRGAGQGAFVGGALGYGSAREQGAAGGVAGGAAFGVAGGFAGKAFRGITGAGRKAAIRNEFQSFLGNIKDESVRDNIVRMVEGKNKKQALENAALIMDMNDFIIGNSKKDVEIKYLSEAQFLEETGGQLARGVQYIKGDKPVIAINTERVNSAFTMAHEAFHAIKRLDGMDTYFQRLKNEIYGVRAGDKVIREGILSPEELNRLSNSYRSKLGDEAKADFDKDVVNNTIEELSADWFAAMMTGSKPDSLLSGKGFDTVSRRALDRLLLADAESALGKMNNALNRMTGGRFNKFSEPVGSMVFKDKDGNDLTHGSPLIHAIMRDMVRAKKRVQDMHHMDNKLPKNVIRTRNLSDTEMTRLKETFKDSPMSELFTTDKKGRTVMVKPKISAQLEAETASKIADAIDSVVDDGESTHVRKTLDESGNEVYSGLRFSDAQLEAIYKSDIHPSIKEYLGSLHEALGNGKQWDIEYFAALRGGSYASIKMSRRRMVPYNIKVSREGNFFARALDISALDRKFDQWRQSRRDWLDNWDSPDDFYTDVQLYLTNLAQPTPEPSAKIFGETKRNILNEFLGARGRKGVNPLALEKMAEKEFLIRSFRLDRIASLNLDNAHETFPFSEVSYQLNKANYMPLVDPAKLSNVPSVKPSDMLNIPDLKGVFPIQADLTATGKYKGIDSSQLTKSNEVLLMGGPEYPRLMSSAGKNLLWAFKADAKITKAYNRAKETGGYAVIVAMDQFSHSTNPSYVEAALQTIDAYAASGKIDSEGIRLANDDVKDVYIRHKTNEWSNSPAGKKANEEQKEAKTLQIKETARDIPSMSEKRFHDWQFKQSFDFRGELIKKLGSAEYEKHGFPAQKRIADALRSPLHHGVGWGDALYLIKLDMDSGIIKLGEDGYPSHPSYDKGIKGEVVGRFSKPISVEALFDPYLKNLKKQKGSLKGFKRSFELSQPVVKVNQKTLSRIGKVDAYTTIKNQRQANLAVDAINGNWKVSGVKKSEGGISVADFARAIKQNNASPSLPKYSTEQLNKMIKNDEIKLYQLGDGQIYFAIKNRTDGGKELVSVMNNEVAAKGVAGPAILIKAIQEGVTHLDAFAVPSKKHPKGFLYDLYSLFGFKETERFSFDEKMYLQENRQRYELDDLKHSWRQIDKWDETMGNPDVTFMELNLDANNRQTYGRDFINPSEGTISRIESASEAGKGEVPQRNRKRSADRGAGSRDSGQDSRDAGVVRGSDVGRSDIGTGFNRLIDEIVNLSDADLKNLGVDTKKAKQARARIGKPDGPLFMPEVDGKPLGPSSEQMLQSLLDGNISRDQFDAAIEVLRPVDKVEVPTEEKIQLNQDNMRKLSMTMKESQLALIGGAEKLPEGTPVGLRIDIPTFNKSVELMRQGVLSEPVYAVTIHEGADNKSKLGTRIGYDIFSRVKRFSKDKPVRFHTINQTRSEQIGTGEKAKTTLATAEGLLVKSRELPKDLSSWAQVGMNPKRHTYFYDRETGQAVKGGDETINFGNTVFVKNPIYYSKAETLSLFTYMPEALGKSEITKTDDGYKAIKRDGKTRVYSPRGKLIGVASSEKVADSIYRRHNARTVSVR